MSVLMHALEADALLNCGHGDTPEAVNLPPETIYQPSKDGDGSPTDADSPSIASRATRGLVQPELARVVAIFTLHALFTRAPHALFSTSKHPYRPRGR